MVTIRKRKSVKRRNPGVPLKRKVNTKIESSMRLRDGITVRLYSTPIVSFNKTAIILNTGGWNTVTTRQRMNMVAREYGLNYHVFNKAREGYVTTKFGTYELTGGERAVYISRATGKARTISSR